MNKPLPILDEWLMYLRKSRQDDPNETVEEVLAKHEIRLQEFAASRLGGRIAEHNILREVVSGESLSDRPMMLELLRRAESSTIKGVLVVDAQRLGRPDLMDAGTIIAKLRFSHTVVLTPVMTFDLEKQHERRYFQDELMRGRDYLDYIKATLLAGRESAAKRGVFLGTKPPYGYRKVKVGKDHTLEPVEDEAQVVRLIFDWYTSGLRPGVITRKLNDMAIPAPLADMWKKPSVRAILRNPHYAGYIAWNQKKFTQVLVDGEIVKKRLSQAKEDMIISEGLHPAIIDRDVWERSQAIIDNNPKNRFDAPVRNPLAGLLRCSSCGCAMVVHPYKHAVDRYECRANPRCFKSVKITDLDGVLLNALEYSELPELKRKLESGEGNAHNIQQSRLARLEKQLQEYRDMEDTQYELLESRQYTPEVFAKRNAALHKKMDECEASIRQVKENMPKSIDYAERIASLEKAIEAFRDPDLTDPAEVNTIMRRIISSIEFTGSPSDRQNKKRQVKKGYDPFSLKITLRL